jgi:hypothetical protein
MVDQVRLVWASADAAARDWARWAFARHSAALIIPNS